MVLSFPRKLKEKNKPFDFWITYFIYVPNQREIFSSDIGDESESEVLELPEEREEEEGMARKFVIEECGDEIDGISEKFQCLALHKNQTAKRGKSQICHSLVWIFEDYSLEVKAPYAFL